MNNQHVPLTTNEEGLVTSIGNQNQENIYETCVLCGKLTDVRIDTHIDYRYGYVEGSGQCCRTCYNKTNDDYTERVMRNRTTLITISAEDILNSPNDFDLGAKVRQLYWSQVGIKQNSENNWVCKICGKDTSNIDIDYLDGTNHLSCVLKTNI